VSNLTVNGKISKEISCVFWPHPREICYCAGCRLQLRACIQIGLCWQTTLGPLLGSLARLEVLWGLVPAAGHLWNTHASWKAYNYNAICDMRYKTHDTKRPVMLQVANIYGDCLLPHVGISLNYLRRHIGNPSAVLSSNENKSPISFPVSNRPGPVVVVAVTAFNSILLTCRVHIQ